MMLVKDLIKILINAENYAEVRCQISDSHIALIRENMPSQYEYFREKEETYQDIINFLNHLPKP